MSYNIVAAPANMREVSQADFFKVIGPLNVDPIPQGGQESISIWKLKTGTVIGKTCNSLNEHGRTKYPLEHRYFLV